MAVWISREEMVAFLLYLARVFAWLAIRSKRSRTNEFMIDMALEETPVSGCTCFSTLQMQIQKDFLVALLSRPFFSKCLVLGSRRAVLYRFFSIFKKSSDKNYLESYYILACDLKSFYAYSILLNMKISPNKNKNDLIFCKNPLRAGNNFHQKITVPDLESQDSWI